MTEPKHYWNDIDAFKQEHFTVMCSSCRATLVIQVTRYPHGPGGVRHCPVCGVRAESVPCPAPAPSEAFRVFCPRHDTHKARYHCDRPMQDDTCPTCQIEDLTDTVIRPGLT